MRTTTYRAPDKTRGYTGGEISAILSRHHPAATVVARVGWRGQVQQLIVTEPDPDPLTAPRRAEVDAFMCETPAPEYGGAPVDDLAALQGSLDATADEEWLRDELIRRGCDVAAIEDVARIVQRHETVADPYDRQQQRQLLVDAGVDLNIVDDVTRALQYRVEHRRVARAVRGWGK